MRVLVNALASPSLRQGGAGFYTATLLGELAGRQEVEITALVSDDVGEELVEFDYAGEIALAQPVPRPLAARVMSNLRAIRAPQRLNWGFDEAARAAISDEAIVHYPLAFMHGPKPPQATRSVVTVHDLQHEVHPAFFSRRDRLLRRLRYRPSARAADHLIAISGFTKEMMCERYGIEAERISTVPLTCRPAFWEPSLESLRGERPHEDRPVLLYPASPLPHKNHLRLLEAFRAYLSDGRTEARLVLVGPRLHDWSSVHQAIVRLGLSRQVSLRMHVSDEELRGLYETSTGLIFPSLFEGFGLPVLEAMASGCPVAAARAGSIPEIAGQAAALFDPTDVESIVEALRWLAGLSNADRRLWAERGRRQAERFRPEQMVEGTLVAYRRAWGFTATELPPPRHSAD